MYFRHQTLGVPGKMRLCGRGICSFTIVLLLCVTLPSVASCEKRYIHTWYVAVLLPLEC